MWLPSRWSLSVVCPSGWIYVPLLLCPAKSIPFWCVCLSVKVDLCFSVALSCKVNPLLVCLCVCSRVLQCVSPFNVFVCLSVKVDSLFSVALPAKCISFWRVCVSVRHCGSMFPLLLCPARCIPFWCVCVSV
jgi:hypothetical protein